jgi:hypothetical protein
MLKYYPAKLN